LGLLYLGTSKHSTQHRLAAGGVGVAAAGNKLFFNNLFTSFLLLKRLYEYGRHWDI